jgi:hypothetical protein
MLSKVIAALSSPRARNYFYALSTAFLAFAVGYDWIAVDKLPLWLTVLAALFAVTSGSTATVVLAQQRKNGTV